MKQKEKNLDKKLINFDADLLPDNPINIEAAKQHGLSYDPELKCYVDSDGYTIRDEYGQPLG